MPQPLNFKALPAYAWQAHPKISLAVLLVQSYIFLPLLTRISFFYHFENVKFDR